MTSTWTCEFTYLQTANCPASSQVKALLTNAMDSKAIYRNEEKDNSISNN